MRNLDWVRDLVESERKMEETGIIDLSSVGEENRDLQLKTHEFLRSLKDSFVEYATAFNNMKNTTLGSVKIYGISNTVSDFMLFRNGYKLLFTASATGRVTMAFQTSAPQFMPSQNQTSAPASEEHLEAIYGPFGDLIWSYRGTQVNPESLVRYYLTRFIRESAK